MRNKESLFLKLLYRGRSCLQDISKVIHLVLRTASIKKVHSSTTNLPLTVSLLMAILPHRFAEGLNESTCKCMAHSKCSKKVPIKKFSF